MCLLSSVIFVCFLFLCFLCVCVCTRVCVCLWRRAQRVCVCVGVAPILPCLIVCACWEWQGRVGNEDSQLTETTTQRHGHWRQDRCCNIVSKTGSALDSWPIIPSPAMLWPISFGPRSPFGANCHRTLCLGPVPGRTTEYAGNQGLFWATNEAMAWAHRDPVGRVWPRGWGKG